MYAYMCTYMHIQIYLSGYFSLGRAVISKAHDIFTLQDSISEVCVYEVGEMKSRGERVGQSKAEHFISSLVCNCCLQVGLLLPLFSWVPYGLVIEMSLLKLQNSGQEKLEDQTVHVVGRESCLCCAAS